MVKLDTMDDRLSQFVDWFEEAEESNETPRELAHRDIDYYDGKQYTPQQEAILKKRKQPAIVFNMIGGKIDTMQGLEIQQRSDPKALPRNKGDDDAAQAATDALRYVEEKEELDSLLSDSFADLARGGIEALEVLVKKTKSGKAEIDIKQPKFDRLFYDPHSSMHDFTDARYMGYVLWWDRDQAEKKFPGKKEAIAGTISETATSTDDFDDKPSFRIWARPGNRPRIRIVTMYWKDGEQWHMTKFTKAGVLKSDPVVFVDDEGESVNPMLMQSAYVDRENARYGAVRRLIGPQDERNKRRSKALHMLNVNQTLGEKGAVDSVPKMKAEMAKPDGHVAVNPNLRFEVIDQSQKTAGHLALMNDADNSIDSIGANAALQGAQQGDPSGRAIALSQQGGIAELTPLNERHRHFKKRIYEAIWQRVRQFWDEERWIRVTDDEKNVKFVGFNRPETIRETIEREVEASGLQGVEVEQELERAKQAGVNLNDPSPSGEIVNVPAEMDMDISIETAPDTITIEQEQFAELRELLNTGLALNDPRMKLLIKASQLRNKHELLDIIEGNEEPSEQEQLATQLEVQTAVANLEKLQGEVEKLASEIEKNRASSIKTIAETDAMDGTLDGQIAGQGPEQAVI